MDTREKVVRFADSHSVRLFPTFVWRSELTEDTRTCINASVLKVVAGLHQSVRPLQSGESWQSKHDLQNSESFAKLVACVDAAAVEVLDFLKIGHEPVTITGCWVNVLAPGKGHRAHSHPNNFLSGVYYVQVEDGADTINFHDPREQASVMRAPVRELTADNTDQVVVRVEAGSLLLFPAWLRHSVSENSGMTERVSVSFNLMFDDYARQLSNPLW